MSGGHDEYRYTIAMCNLNNFETLEESIESIHTQITDDFEILIVDDGSTDGSVELLEEIEETHQNIRLVKGDNDNLAEARNHSFREANGEYVISAMDLDDRYNTGIMSFVEVYEQMDEQIDGEFYVCGRSIDMAPRSLLLDYPLRSLGYGEDRDHWRRLFADDKMIWLSHEGFREMLRENYGTTDLMKTTFGVTVVDFRSGISFWSLINYCLTNLGNEAKRNGFRLVIAIFAYVVALNRGRYAAPSPQYRKMGQLNKNIHNKSMQLSEVEQHYGIKVDRSELSQRGRDIFAEQDYSEHWFSE